MLSLLNLLYSASSQFWINFFSFFYIPYGIGAAQGRLILERCNKANPDIPKKKEKVAEIKNGNVPWTKGRKKLYTPEVKGRKKGVGREERTNLIQSKESHYIYLDLVLFIVNNQTPKVIIFRETILGNKFWRKHKNYWNFLLELIIGKIIGKLLLVCFYLIS